MVVLINVFTLDPAKQRHLLSLLANATSEYVRHAPGFIRATLHRSLDATKVTMYAEWRSREDYENMRRGPRPLPIFEEALAIARFEPAMYEVVQSFVPTKAG
jgi:quinol monooxygenase YgiN